MKLMGHLRGDVSAEMLAACGLPHVIILGHSERRNYFEHNDLINKKATSAINSGLQVIICIGETLSEEKNKGQTNDKVLELQLNPYLFLIENTVIAYEPIWAIGTGKTASLEANSICS